MRAGFVWDDVDHIAANPRIDRWSALPEYFGRPQGRYYRPLVFVSYIVDAHVWGRSARAYHAVNIALHLLNAFLLGAAVRRSGLRPAVAAAAALLFAVHPVQSEAVAYVSGRTDLLMTACALGAWNILLGSGPAWRRGALAALSAGAAILAKESGYALLLLVPWLAWKRAGRTGERLQLALPTFLFGAVLLALRPGGVSQLTDGMPSLSLLGGAGRAALAYVGVLIWPATLMVDRLTILPPTAGGLLLGLAGLAAIWVAVLGGVSRRGAAAEWTAWSAAFYLPVANLVALYPAIAERALFTPEHNLYPSMAGLAVLAAIVFDRMRSPRFVKAAGVALIVALAARTAIRAGDWRDEERLFASAAGAGSISPRVHYNLGNVLLAKGEVAAAARALESAVALSPNDGQAWANLGVARQRLRDRAGALAAEERAVALLPADPTARENLAALYFESGDIGRARAAWSDALRLDPSRSRARAMLGLLDVVDAGR